MPTEFILSLPEFFGPLLNKIRHIIVGIIDFCHIPLLRFIPVQTFRYLACGGTNTVLGIAIDYVGLNYIFHHQYIALPLGIMMEPQVGAWLLAFVISFPAGFVLSRYIVFPESNLHGHIQLIRYAIVTISFIIITYLLVKFFATYVHWLNDTVAYTFITIICAVLSYISQRHFTFKSKPTPGEVAAASLQADPVVDVVRKNLMPEVAQASAESETPEVSVRHASVNGA